MPPAWKRWAGLQSFWCITCGTSSARKYRPAKTTFTFFNLVGIKLISGMVQKLYEQESRRPWGPAGKMNWPSFSEPEMFAGQNRSKNKKYCYVFTLLALGLLAFFWSHQKIFTFPGKNVKKVRSLSYYRWIIVDMHNCTSGHKHVETYFLGCMLWNMWGLGRDLVLNPCLCS